MLNPTSLADGHKWTRAKFDQQLYMSYPSLDYPLARCLPSHHLDISNTRSGIIFFSSLIMYTYLIFTAL